jgi:hypothetical protein
LVGLIAKRACAVEWLQYETDATAAESAEAARAPSHAALSVRTNKSDEVMKRGYDPRRGLAGSVVAAAGNGIEHKVGPTGQSLRQQRGPEILVLVDLAEDEFVVVAGQDQGEVNLIPSLIVRADAVRGLDAAMARKAVSDRQKCLTQGVGRPSTGRPLLMSSWRPAGSLTA